MTNYWWKDLLDQNKCWQGLELTVRKGNRLALGMQSGHNGRMALQVNGEALFWATVLNDHSGVWLVFNAEHPAQRQLLPSITSFEVESARRLSKTHQSGDWCRYFSRQLMAAPTPLLSPGRWGLRPMEPVKPAAPYVLNKHVPVEKWRFETPSTSQDISVFWSLYSEDFPNLQKPENVMLVDWWWGGNKLLARYSVAPDSGRVKWWRKKCREGALPPVLVWFISGLASFVILDGHDRMQAALAEGLQPQFLVLSELSEDMQRPDEKTRERILHSLAIQQEKLKKTGSNIDAMNQMLMNLYSTRYLYATTHSRAVLGNGEGWEGQVKAYLLRQNMEAHLDKILSREE